MNRVLWVMLIVLLATSSAAGALGLRSVSLGLHFTPAIDRVEGRRIWDLSFSLSAVMQLDAYDSIEGTVVIDSAPTTLGTIAEYRHDVTAGFSAGAGVTVLWPFGQNETLMAPVLESFARVAVHGTIFHPLC